jgi:DNA (cytosine-5)-methyltransferase 1
MKFIDLFAGIGGFRIALEAIGAKCVFSSEIDKYAKETYKVNFGEEPFGDIFEIKSDNIPDHDILCAGFPCQPFSIAGRRLGFDDARGTLFFQIARIINDKHPKAFILENVAGIVSHDNGNTIKVIENTLNELGYTYKCRLMNAKDYGVPQNRNRWYCVGVNTKLYKEIDLEKVFPKKIQLEATIADLLDSDVGEDHYVSPIALKNIETHIMKYKSKHIEGTNNPTIANNIRPSKVSFSSNGISPCLTAKMGTGGNNVPVIYPPGRKLTTNECLRLMSFPEGYYIKPNYSQSYKQIGNSVVVKMIMEIGRNLIQELNSNENI